MVSSVSIVLNPLTLDDLTSDLKKVKRRAVCIGKEMEVERDLESCAAALNKNSLVALCLRILFPAVLKSVCAVNVESLSAGVCPCHLGSSVSFFLPLPPFQSLL